MLTTWWTFIPYLHTFDQLCNLYYSGLVPKCSQTSIWESSIQVDLLAYYLSSYFHDFLHGHLSVLSSWSLWEILLELLDFSDEIFADLGNKWSQLRDLCKVRAEQKMVIVLNFRLSRYITLLKTGSVNKMALQKVNLLTWYSRSKEIRPLKLYQGSKEYLSL
jgi:hypothetical protein